MKASILPLMALGCCLPAPLLTACGDGGKPAAAQAADPQDAVSVFHILPKRVQDTRDWYGQTSATGKQEIHPRITGTVQEIHYTEGARVKKGDLLYTLDPTLFQAELERARANLKAAEAATKTAQVEQTRTQKDLERNEKLNPSGAVSDMDLQTARHNHQAAVAGVKTARAQEELQRAAVRKAELDLERTRITAPEDGIAGINNVSPGDTVNPASCLTTMYAADPMEVKFSITSEQFLAVQQYLAAGTPVEFRLVLEDGTLHPSTGHVTALDNIITQNGMIEVTGAIEAPGAALRGNMTVRVRIATGEKDALLVPQQAISTQQLNTFVTVVDPQGLPRLIPVNTAGTYETKVVEKDEFSTMQPLVAITGTLKPLADSLRELGYAHPQDAPVVADSAAAAHVSTLVAQNARAARTGARPGSLKTRELSFKPAVSPAMRRAALSLTDPRPAAGLQATLPPFPVKVAPMLRQDVEISRTWKASLRGVQEPMLRPRVSGILLEDTGIPTGSLVKEGDLLFRIDPQDYELAVETARAALQAAQAAQEQAAAKRELCKDDADRFHKVAAKMPGSISEKTVTDADLALLAAEAAVSRAEAEAAQAQAALHTAELNLGYTRITSPINGRLGDSIAANGSMVTPESGQALAMVSSTDPMQVDLNVSGLDALAGLREYAAGQAGSLEFDVQLEDGTLHPHRGTVTGCAADISKTTGTLHLVGRVPNPGAALRSGTPVQVRAVSRQIKNAWLVPARAPISSGGNTFVIVLQPDTPAPCILPVKLREIVNIPVTGPDGKPTVQPMQVIEPDERMLSALVQAIYHTDTVAQAIMQYHKAANWKELATKLLQQESPAALEADMQASGAETWREYLLAKTGAADELELIARQNGCADLMELLLKQLGVPDGTMPDVVVEGTQLALKTAQENISARADVNLLRPVPFSYTPTQPVEESVTAKPAADQD